MKGSGLLALGVLLGLGGAAAAQPAEPMPVVTSAQGYELRLLGGGLAAGRRGLHSYPVWEFGISRTEALRRVSALRGAAGPAGNRTCAGRNLNFARFGTLTLWFRGNRWTGWSLTGPAGRRPIRTEWGLGIGTARAAIGDADTDRPVFRRTPGGTEFTFQDMHGLLAGRGRQARIAALWAGESCAGR